MIRVMEIHHDEQLTTLVLLLGKVCCGQWGLRFEINTIFWRKSQIYINRRSVDRILSKTFIGMLTVVKNFTFIFCLFPVIYTIWCQYKLLWSVTLLKLLESVRLLKFIHFRRRHNFIKNWETKFFVQHANKHADVTCLLPHFLYANRKQIKCSVLLSVANVPLS